MDEENGELTTAMEKRRGADISVLSGTVTQGKKDGEAAKRRSIRSGADGIWQVPAHMKAESREAEKTKRDYPNKNMVEYGGEQC